MLGSIVVPFLSNLSINVGIILASSVVVLSTAGVSCCMINVTYLFTVEINGIDKQIYFILNRSLKSTLVIKTCIPVSFIDPMTPGSETYMSTGGILGHLRCQWDY